MTRDDIIRMAREADKYADKLEPCWINEYTEIRDQRFAELIKQHLISEGYRKCAEGQRTTQFCGQLEAAVAAEREACAKVCEDKNTLLRWPTYAAAVRARGEK